MRKAFLSAHLAILPRFLNGRTTGMQLDWIILMITYNQLLIIYYIQPDKPISYLL